MPSDAEFKQNLCADFDELSLQAAVRCAAEEREANCAHHRPVRFSWARLLKPVFESDLERCPNCGGELRIIAA